MRTLYAHLLNKQRSHVSTHAFTQVRTNKLDACTSKRARLLICIHAYKHIHIYAQTRFFTSMRASTHTCARLQTQAHANTFTHTRT